MEEIQLLKRLLINMQDTFMEPGVPMKGLSSVAHYIDTGDTRPIKIAPRLIAPGSEEVIVEEEAAKMLEAGVIRESTSPWSSPIVLVQKKDGTTRFCIDYRN
jgi:hypothetical protein